MNENLDFWDMQNDRGKRGNPDYKQVTGYIPRELAKAFQMKCLELEITRADGLEQAIAAWIALKGSPKIPTNTTE